MPETNEDGMPVEKLGDKVKMVRGIWYSDGDPYRRWIPAYKDGEVWRSHDDSETISSVDAVLEMSQLDSAFESTRLTFRARKVDHRGWYLVDRSSIYYLYSDGKYRLGVRGDGKEFWPTKDEAEAFYDLWKKKKFNVNQ